MWGGIVVGRGGCKQRNWAEPTVWLTRGDWKLERTLITTKRGEAVDRLGDCLCVEIFLLQFVPITRRGRFQAQTSSKPTCKAVNMAPKTEARTARLRRQGAHLGHYVWQHGARPTMRCRGPALALVPSLCWAGGQEVGCVNKKNSPLTAQLSELLHWTYLLSFHPLLHFKHQQHALSEPNLGQGPQCSKKSNCIADLYGP